MCIRDSYWLNTSFVRLPMDQSDLLHDECSRMLANSLCEIGTIKIIHDDKMIAINKAFVKFIEELEKRVISYSDFMQYKMCIRDSSRTMRDRLLFCIFGNNFLEGCCMMQQCFFFIIANF